MSSSDWYVTKFVDLQDSGVACSDVVGGRVLTEMLSEGPTIVSPEVAAGLKRWAMRTEFSVEGVPVRTVFSTREFLSVYKHADEPSRDHARRIIHSIRESRIIVFARRLL